MLNENENLFPNCVELSHNQKITIHVKVSRKEDKDGPHTNLVDYFVDPKRSWIQFLIHQLFLKGKKKVMYKTLKWRNKMKKRKSKQISIQLRLHSTDCSCASAHYHYSMMFQWWIPLLTAAVSIVIFGPSVRCAQSKFINFD